MGAYIYFETRHQDISDYMQTNWLGWPKDLDDKITLKAKIK